MRNVRNDAFAVAGGSRASTSWIFHADPALSADVEVMLNHALARLRLRS
jgi:hypothetical protein